jgi:predicted DCC family thiol-disulfide oxidoreductase YuxK
LDIIKKTFPEKFFDFTCKDNYLIGASLLRIGFGIIILYNYVLHYSQRYFLWSSDGLLGTNKGLFSLYMLNDSRLYFDVIFHLGALIAFLYTIGIFGKSVGLLNYIFTFSLIQISHFLSDGGDNLMYLFLFYLLFANTTAYYSVDSIKFHENYDRKKDTTLFKIRMIVHNFAVLACVIQVCIIYMSSGLYQVMGEMWNNGTAIYYILQVDVFSNPLFREILLENDYLLVFAAYAAIIVKLAFPFLIFNQKSKYIVVLLMVSFHASIGITMGLVTFSLIMIVADLLMISDEEYNRIYKYVRKKFYRSKIISKFILRKKVGKTPSFQAFKVVVFYDGWCPFCIKSVHRLKRMDYFGLIKYVSFRKEGVIKKYNLDLEKLEKRMHSKKLNGSVKEGIFAFIQISKRLPPLWPMVPVLYLGQLMGVGQKVYDYIASNRSIVPSGKCDNECSINFKNQNG